MYYFIGLGNPGDKYEGTRHNIGFTILNELADSFAFSTAEKQSHLSAYLRKGLIGDTAVCCVFPYTFMNNSGVTVQKLLQDDTNAQCVIVHDDSALPLGTIRFSKGKGAGGHNGVRSIFEHTKENNFLRLRVGIQPLTFWKGEPKHIPGEKRATFVLGKFSVLEKAEVKKVAALAIEALETLLEKGEVKAMDIYNR